MKITFRQGIVSYQTSGFLFFNNTTGKVDLRATDRPVIVSVAHKHTDYIFTEDGDVESAWSDDFEVGKDYWLYWDFDLFQFAGSCRPTTYQKTGSYQCHRTFGSTQIEPIVSDVAPVSPRKGQIWYDRANYKHFEWSGGSWVEKLRVFACKLENGRNIIPFSVIPVKDEQITKLKSSFNGTQIGDMSSVFAGRPIHDESGMVIKRDDGTFFTTEDQFFADKARVDAIRLESNVIRAQNTGSSLSAFSVVAFSKNQSPPEEEGRIVSATYDDVADSNNGTIVGIVTENLQTGDVGQVIVQGVVTNLNWNWLSIENVSVGDKLWIDNGLLVHENPHVVDPLNYPRERTSVARILNTNTVIFGYSMGSSGSEDSSDSTIDVLPATTNDLGVVRLSIPAGTGVDNPNSGSTDDQPIVVETTDSRLYDARDPKPHSHSANEVYVDPGKGKPGTIQFEFDNLEQNFVHVEGDTMTGDLVLFPQAPLTDQSAVPKHYVDKLTSGLLWQEPVNYPNLINSSSIQAPEVGKRNTGDMYVINSIGTGSRPWEQEKGLSDVVPGNVVIYVGNVAGWEIAANSINDYPKPRRFGVAMDSDSEVGGGLIKNTIVDNTFQIVFDPRPVDIPPSPALTISAENSPNGITNEFALFGYVWNGNSWLKTQGSAVNFGGWIHGNRGDSYSVDPSSYSLNSTAIGSQAESYGTNSVAIGTNSVTSGGADNSVAIGSTSAAIDEDSISIGTEAKAYLRGISIGKNSTSFVRDSIAIGVDTTASGQESIVIGNSIVANEPFEIRIGNKNNNLSVTKDGVLTVDGADAQIQLPTSVSSPPAEMGYPGGLVYSDDGKIWMWNGNSSPNRWEWVNSIKGWIHGNDGEEFEIPPHAVELSVAIGNNAKTISSNSLVFGNDSLIQTDSEGAISIGSGNKLDGAFGSIVIGNSIEPVNTSNVIVIGNEAEVEGFNDIAIGWQSVASSSFVSDKRSAIAIGMKANAGSDSVVIGDNAGSEASDNIENSVVIGSQAFTNKKSTIVIGDQCTLDKTDKISKHPYEGEFIKIGGSGGSDMYMKLTGEPDNENVIGGHFIVHAPHGQIGLPKYNPPDYPGGFGLNPADGLPVDLYSRPGALVYDLTHEVYYPEKKDEPRVKVYNPDKLEWVPVGAEYLYELGDVAIDYPNGDAKKMRVLTFKDGVWIPHYVPIRANNDNEFRNQPVATGENSVAIGDSTSTNGQRDTFVMGQNLVIPTPDDAEPCYNYTTMIGRSTSYLTLAQKGQFTVHGDNAQLIAPDHDKKGNLFNQGCLGGIVYHENELKVWVSSDDDQSLPPRWKPVYFNWINANGGLNFPDKPLGNGERSIAIGNFARAFGDDSIAIGNQARANPEDTIAIGTGTSIPNLGDVNHCLKYTTMIGRKIGGRESYLTLAEEGQFTTHGDSAQIVLPSYAGPISDENTPIDKKPVNLCHGGMVWDESEENALIWDDKSSQPGEWKPIGGAGGGSIEVPITDFPSSPPLDKVADIGRPVYFDGSKWRFAQANDITTVHVGVITKITSSKVTITLAGMCEEITSNAIEGGSGSLTPGSFYYLSITEAGRVTDVRPGEASFYITAPVWIALSPTTATVLPYRAGKKTLTTRRKTIWSNTGIIGHNPLPDDNMTFPMNYAIGNLDVYLNGVLLDSGEYTATDGKKFTLKEPILNPQFEVVTAYEMNETGIVPSSYMNDNGDGTYIHIGANKTETIIDTNKSLNDLIDVDADLPKEGHVISWIGGKWVTAENIQKRSKMVWTDVEGTSTFDFKNIPETLDVYLNGSKLIEDLEYTSNGDSITLAEPISSESDVLFATTDGIGDVILAPETRAYTENEIDKMLDKKLNSLYPVGMIWMSIADQDPNDTLPGKWSLMKQGEFSSDDNKLPVNMWQRKQ